MDNFRQLSVFTKVVEAGSFTRAAQLLGVSRATVSVTVQQLEEHLGVRLVQRTTRRVSLTNDGRVLYAHAREVLSKLEATVQLFQGTSRKVAGRLCVDVPSRIARRVIMPALPEFLQRHPALHVQLGASDRMIELLDEGVDAVIRVGRLQDSDFIVRPLGCLAQVNCASPHYLARYGQPVHVDELDTHVVVAYAAGSRASSAAWDYTLRGEQRSRPMRSLVTVDNAETYVAACLAGLGLIQVPAYDVRHHLESGALVSVMPRYAPNPLPVSLLYPSRKQLPARLSVFAAWVAELFVRQGMFEPGDA